MDTQSDPAEQGSDRTKRQVRGSSAGFCCQVPANPALRG